MSRAIFLIVLGLAACKDEPPSSNGAPPPPRPTPQSAPGSAESAASASPQPLAAPSAASSADPDAAAFAGAWEGAYDAKRGSVELPPSVKDKTWIKDDGKTATGPGTLAIAISPSGEVTGNGKGALGPLDVIGKVDGTMLRASVIPRDPAANAAMTGVFVGALKEGAIVGEIRVAGPDAAVVRESAVTLKRK